MKKAAVVLKHGPATESFRELQRAEIFKQLWTLEHFLLLSILLSGQISSYC